MKKSEMFKAAHKDAKMEIEMMGGNYREEFSLQLKIQGSMVSTKETKADYANLSVSEIYNAIIMDAARIQTGSFGQTFILEDVAQGSKGFQSDIAKRALESGRLSEKQAWCIAYEAKKIA